MLLTEGLSPDVGGEAVRALNLVGPGHLTAVVANAAVGEIAPQGPEYSCLLDPGVERAAGPEEDFYKQFHAVAVA